MVNTLEIVKGIHPGFMLERELKKRKLSKGQFALSIREYPQTLSAIMKGKRSMNTPPVNTHRRSFRVGRRFFHDASGIL